jgi:hypothetical protein
MCKPGNYSGVAPERCLKISTAILSACRCLSNDEISNSIRAIAALIRRRRLAVHCSA